MAAEPNSENAASRHTNVFSLDQRRASKPVAQRSDVFASSPSHPIETDNKVDMARRAIVELVKASGLGDADRRIRQAGLQSALTFARLALPDIPSLVEYARPRQNSVDIDHDRDILFGAALIIRAAVDSVDQTISDHAASESLRFAVERGWTLLGMVNPRSHGIPLLASDERVTFGAQAKAAITFPATAMHAVRKQPVRLSVVGGTEAPRDPGTGPRF